MSLYYREETLTKFKVKNGPYLTVLVICNSLQKLE